MAPLPSGFMGAAMQSAANTQRGLEQIGSTIGDALKTYGKRKEESEMLDGLIQGQAQRALELNQFLGSDKPVTAHGAGPDGQDVTYDPSRKRITGSLPAAPGMAETGETAETMAEVYGLPSPLSQKTELLYDIAGDQKLVDKFLSGDATLAQKKGLLANLQMYNTKLDDYSKYAAIDEHRFKKAQRDAYSRSYGQRASDRVISPATTEQETTTNEIASKQRLDSLLHRQETGQTLTPEQFDMLESYFASGGSYRPSTGGQSGPQPGVPAPAPQGQNTKPASAPKAKLPDFSSYSRDIEKERETHAASKGVLAALEAGLYQTTSERARIERELSIARGTPGKKVDPKLVEQSRALGNTIKAYDQSLKTAREDIKGREEYLSYMDNEAQKFAEQAKDAIRTELPKIAQLGVPKYLAGQLIPKAKATLTESSGNPVVRPGIPPMPDSGYVDGPWTETQTTTRSIPAVTAPASMADHKAARIKAFIEEGGTMTPAVVAQFDKEYPNVEVGLQQIPGTGIGLVMQGNKVLEIIQPPEADDGPSLTEFQGKTLLNLRRMQSAQNEIERIQKKFDPTSSWQRLKIIAPRELEPAEWEEYEKAMYEWTDAMLRQTTGAQATEAEVERNKKTYFPQPGQGQGASDQAARMRGNAMNTMLEMLPNRYGPSQPPSGSNAPAMRRFDATGKEVK